MAARGAVNPDCVCTQIAIPHVAELFVHARTFHPQDLPANAKRYVIHMQQEIWPTLICTLSVMHTSQSQRTKMSRRVAARDRALPLLDGRHPVEVPPHRRKLEVHHPITVTYTQYDTSGTIIMGRYQMTMSYCLTCIAGDYTVYRIASCWPRGCVALLSGDASKSKM